MKKRKPPTIEEIREANKRHDAEFSKKDINAYRKIKNSFYSKTDTIEFRESLGTGWSNYRHDSNFYKSDIAQNSILRNQIRIKQGKSK